MSSLRICIDVIPPSGAPGASSSHLSNLFIAIRSIGLFRSVAGPRTTAATAAVSAFRPEFIHLFLLVGIEDGADFRAGSLLDCFELWFRLLVKSREKGIRLFM